MQKQIETTIRQDLENIWIYPLITKGNGFGILIFGKSKFSGNRHFRVIDLYDEWSLSGHQIIDMIDRNDTLTIHL